LVYRYFHGAPLPPPPPPTLKEVRLIFDRGKNGGGGAGHPGHDLDIGVTQALGDTAAFFSDRNIATPLRVEDDSGDPVRATILATEAVKDKNVLVVVGHLTSSIMKATQDIYLKGGVPIIMPVPTNPELTSEPHKEGYANVLRMPPTDLHQAAVASEFMLSRDVKKIAVIRDGDNITYSRYLASKFIRNIRDNYSRTKGGPIVAYETIVGEQIVSEFLPDVFVKLKIDAIFFAGSTDNAITFLETLNAYRVSAEHPAALPSLILMTDGVVESGLLHKLSNIPQDLYVTFPFSKKGTVKNGDIGRICAGQFELSYCPYGYDSVILLKNILAGIPLSRWHNGDVAREDVLKQFDEIKKQAGVVPGTFGDYLFDDAGDNFNSAFQFSRWKATKERFVEE
jgi:hypothetical protein